MHIEYVSRVYWLAPVMVLLLSAGCGGGGDSDTAVTESADPAAEVAAEEESAAVEAPAETPAEVPDACALFDQMELEQTLGWELGEGDPESAPAGGYACDFDVKPLFYVTRTYENPPLPESIGFNSLMINTYAQTATAFNEFRELLADAGEDVSGIGDGAYFYGFDMLYVRVGGKAFSLRIYTDAQTDEDRALVREVMLTLAGKGAAKL